MRVVAFLVRIALAALLVTAGVLKWFAGAQLVVEAMQVFEIPERNWVYVERAVSAIGLFEVVLGAMILLSSVPKNWNVLAVCSLVGFGFWDVSRWLAGSDPDCACFGSIAIASTWAHVWVKHLILWSAIGFLIWRGAPGGDQERASSGTRLVSRA